MEELLKILRELHGEVDFEAHTALVDGKVLDSFDIVTIITAVADDLGVSIPPEEIVAENFNSAAALHSLIERLRSE